MPETPAAAACVSRAPATPMVVAPVTALSAATMPMLAKGSAPTLPVATATVALPATTTPVVAVAFDPALSAGTTPSGSVGGVPETPAASRARQSKGVLDSAAPMEVDSEWAAAVSAAADTLGAALVDQQAAYVYCCRQG